MNKDMRIVVESLGLREIADSLRDLSLREWAGSIAAIMLVCAVIFVLSFIG